jgi:dihydroorotase-like cyclic amidohydrolase
VIRFAGVSLRDAVDMAGARPRELLGLPPRRLETGQPADLVLFDWQEGGAFQVRGVVVPGERLAESGAAGTGRD